MIVRVAIVLLLGLLAACGGEELREARAALELSPAAIDFGGVIVNRAATAEVQVRNVGTAAGTLTVVSAPEGFRVEPASLPVASGVLTSVQVKFLPDREGPFEGTIVFSGPAESPLEVAVKGAGSFRVLDAEPELDFGQVPLGDTRTLPLDVASLADVHLDPTVELGGTDVQMFGVSDGRLSLPPQGTGRIFVRFAPDSRGHAAGGLVLKPCENCEDVRVTLRGEGVGEAAFVSPNPLELGILAPGTSVRREVRVTNRGDVDTWLVGAQLIHAPGAPIRLARQDWPVLVSGASTLLYVDFAPETEGEWDATLRLLVAGEVVDVPVHGRAQVASLRATPESIDFGVAVQGQNVRRTLRLENTAPGNVTVERLDLEQGAGATFSLGAQAVPFNVGTAPIQLSVDFLSQLPVEAQGTVHVAVHERPDSNLAIPIRGSVVPTGSGCDLDVPSELRFGLVHVGEVERRTLVLRNLATSTCYLWGFSLDGDAPFRWVNAPGDRVQIAAGAEAAFELEYAPAEPRLNGAEARVRFSALDAVRPTRAVDLRAAAAVLPLVVTPETLDFGEVLRGSTHVRAVTLRNTGRSDLAIVQVLAQGGSEFGLAEAIPPFVLPGLGERTVFVRYIASTAGPNTGELAVYVQGVPEPLRVPIAGEAQIGTCPDCDRPIAGCPAPVTVTWPGAVTLRGVGLQPNRMPVTCNWLDLAGASGELQQLSGNDACSALYEPYAPGTYSLQLDVTGAAGTSSCVADVTAVPAPGLAIAASWSDAVDLDVHLFHPDAGSPVDVAWESGSLDCSVANPTPSWDAPGTDDDPFLYESAGVGPGHEHLRLDTPVPGHRYGVGLHYAASGQGFSATTGTVSLSCGGVQVTTVTVPLAALHDRAHVGTVEWNADGTCTFTPGSR